MLRDLSVRQGINDEVWTELHYLVRASAEQPGRNTEALTALLISVNARYKVHAGIRLTSLPEHLWE